MSDTKFYEFRQNNSGGHFVFLEGKISHYVSIEAHNADEANAIAERLAGMA